MKRKWKWNEKVARSQELTMSASVKGKIESRKSVVFVFISHYKHITSISPEDVFEIINEISYHQAQTQPPNHSRGPGAMQHSNFVWCILFMMYDDKLNKSDHSCFCWKQFNWNTSKCFSSFPVSFKMKHHLPAFDVWRYHQHHLRLKNTFAILIAYFLLWNGNEYPLQKFHSRFNLLQISDVFICANVALSFVNTFL